MSYNAREVSAYEGQPVLLFRFAFQGAAYPYASGDAHFDYSGDTYTATEISMSVPTQAAEVKRAQVEIRMPRSAALPALFIQRAPAGSVTVEVFRFHRDDGEVKTFWSGRILNCSFQDSEAILTADPYIQSLRRKACRQQFGPRCQHVVYDELCGVDPANYEVSTAVSLVSGLTVRAPAFAAEAQGYWLGGYIKRSNGDQAMIAGHDAAPNGDRVYLLSQLPGLTVGEAVIIAPGCDGTESTCENVFNNYSNILIFPHVPRDNPFTAGVK